MINISLPLAGILSLYHYRSQLQLMFNIPITSPIVKRPNRRKGSHQASPSLEEDIQKRPRSPEMTDERWAATARLEEDAGCKSG